ncbi:complement factor H-like isoform X2 [Perca fluviatilis]|uniref:complement factor H-like isoform X2 n=1 Tax=Perca fluviatilis TaxID=8168 RepID=UPI001965C066|nr:complement factor H-like isoform X2 [Perca fluviatilis]
MCVRYLGFVLLVWFPGGLHSQSAGQPCRALTLDGGYLVPEENTYSHEANLTYGCDNGLKPAVEGWWATITCQNGEWSPKPQCIDEKACIPPDIPNAQYKKNLRGWYKNNQRLRVRCDEGYEHKGNDATAICTNGTWSSVPVCEKSIKACGEPPKIPHAVIIHQVYHELFAADSVVQYECEDGYTVEGGGTKEYITCMSGSWTEGPMCNRGTSLGTGDDGGTSGSRTPPAGGGWSATSGSNERDRRPPFTADRGTSLGTGDDGGTSGSRTPPAGGGWSATSGSNERDRRPPFTAGRGTRPEKGLCGDRGTSLGTGDDGGTSGSRTPPAGWSATSGSNERDRRPSFTAVIHCGAYPIVPNGDVVKEDPMFLKYQCNAFYKQVGSDTVRCHSEGNWSQLPICQEAFCVIDLAQYPVGGVKLSGREYVTEGETKYIQCIWNYYSSRVQCINRTFFYTQCCHHYDHYRGACS